MNHQKSPQFLIQDAMRAILDSGNYDMVHLFSSEGLPLAECYSNGVVPKDRLVELSILFRELKQMADLMGKISNIKELILEGNNHRKVVFRFFRAFNQEVVLAIVVPPKKSYRGLTNSLIKTIEEIAL
jgi:hypothetical protein